MHNLEKEIRACDKCPRLVSVTPHRMPHIFYNDNIEDLRLFVVMRNPGLENDTSNVSHDKFMEYYKEKWFDCRVGKYLRERLGDKVIRQHTFFTNVCKCSSPQNSQLTEDEITNCNPFLKRQIELITPICILTFGADALNSVCPGISLQSKFGKVVNDNVIPLYHPAFFAYKPNTELSKKQDEILYKIGESLS